MLPSHQETVSADDASLNPYAAPSTVSYQQSSHDEHLDSYQRIAHRKVRDVASMFRAYGAFLGVGILLSWWNIINSMSSGIDQGRNVGQDCAILVVGSAIVVWYYIAAYYLMRFELSVKIQALILSILMLIPCMLTFPFAASAFYRILVYLREPNVA